MEVIGCATGGAICPCAPAQNPRERPQVLPAYGLQDLRNKHQNQKTNPYPNTMYLQTTLGENHGSGHFYLAKNRTFLLCVDSSEWEKAEKQFRAEVYLQPGNAEAAYRLGEALLEQGKMNEAAEELRRSDALASDMPETLYVLGKATAVSDPAAGEEALTRVTELEKGSPLSGQAYLTLTTIHRKQGKTELAAKEMQECRQIQSATKTKPPTKQ